MNRISIAIALVLVGAGIARMTSVAATAAAADQKPMPRLSCSAGQRIVFEIRPTDSPFITNIRKTDWSGFFSGLSTGFAMGGVAGVAGGAERGPASTDVTDEFARGVRGSFERTDVDRLILAGVERTMREKSTCDVVFMTTEERRKAKLFATDRIVMIGLFVEFQGGKPTMTARMGAALVTKIENLAFVDDGAERMHTLQAEIQSSKRPSLGKAKEFLKLAQQASTAFAGGLNDAQKSPSHEVQDWLADDAKLVIAELTAAADRMLASLAGALFQ